MNYNYFGYTSDKKTVKGSVSASSEKEAREIISSYGHMVLKLEQSGSINPDWRKLLPSLFAVKTEDIIIFSRQLKLLTEAGHNIVTSLELLFSQASNPTFKKALREIILEIRAGGRVADAMSKYPEVFPPIYCRSISVGEQTGEMGLMLEQIADYLETELNSKKGLKSALMYPIVVATLAIGVMLMMVYFILPVFEELYSSLGAQLPAMTRMLMTGGNVLRSYGPAMLGVLVVAVTGIALYVRTPSGKYQRDKLAFSLPLAGLINLLQELSYCCRTMAVLFRSGLSSTEIMDITIESSNNLLMREALVGVKQAMLRGEGLGKPMSENRLFLPMMVAMVKVGEETGGLGDTLVVVAQTYDAEASAKTRMLARFLQTTMTIGIAAMVSIVVLSMLTTMYSVFGQMG